jgi:hypothetical protein
MAGPGGLASVPVEAASSDAVVVAVGVVLEVVQDPDLEHWSLFPQTGLHVHGQLLAAAEGLVMAPCYEVGHRHEVVGMAHREFRVLGVDEQSHRHT